MISSRPYLVLSEGSGKEVGEGRYRDFSRLCLVLSEVPTKEAGGLRYLNLYSIVSSLQ